MKQGEFHPTTNTTMAIAQKDLLSVNDNLTINNPSEEIGDALVQYVSGAGTIVLEGTMSDGTAPVWAAILLTNITDGTTTAAPTLVGIYRGNASGLEQVRVRKTVGVLSCVVRLGVDDA